MKKLYAIILSLGIIGMSSCDYLAKDISEDMNFTVNGDLFKNTVQIEVVDAATGQAIPSLKGIYIEGPNSDVIYSQTGKKNPEYINNLISLGVDPKFLFTNDNPLEFNVAVNAVGYIPEVKTIIVNPEQFNQQVRIEMINPLVGSSSMDIEIIDIPLNNGKVISNQLIKKTGQGPDTLYFDDDFTTVGIPVGTQFYGWKENSSGEFYSSITTWDDEIVKFENNGKERYSKISLSVDTFKLSSYVTEVPYTGSKIRAVFYYPKEKMLPYFQEYNMPWRKNRRSWYNPDYEFSGQTVALINKPLQNCIFFNAVEKQILKVVFWGEAPNGKEFEIWPSGENIYYSLRLDPNFINPVTNQPIKEGDLIELKDEVYIKRVNGSPELFVFNFPIKKDKNGHLRAQVSNPDVGFYKEKKDQKTISVTIESLEKSTIPDIENLTHDAYILLNNSKISVNEFLSRYYVVANRIDFIKDFVSEELINNLEFYYTLKYFNKIILNNKKVEHLIEMDPNNEIDKSKLFEEVRFDINIFCSGGTRIKPSVFTKVFVPSENTYYYANIKNGQWVTRGIEVGKEIKLNFTYDNIKVDTTVILQSLNVIKKDVAGSQFCQ